LVIYIIAKSKTDSYNLIYSLGVENGVEQQFQSMSWRWDGRVMITSSKVKNFQKKTCFKVTLHFVSLYEV